MRDDMDTFRDSMNEWIVFLDEAVKEQRGTIRDLTERLEEMEARIRVGL